MRRMIVLALTALLAASACQKPFETSIELGVNNEKIQLPSFEEGHCFITVFSNAAWTIRLDSGEDWASLGQRSGTGIDYVRFDYSENLSAAPREATVVVEGSGKRCEILVTQPSE